MIPIRVMAMALMCLVFVSAGCGANTHQQLENESSASASQGDDAAKSPLVAKHHQKPWYRKGLRTYGFQSPTGNLRCALESDDPAQLLCKSLADEKAVDLDDLLRPDSNITATIPAEPTLRYGRAWSSSKFYCWSEIAGVTCRSLYSRQGFKINRDGITELIWKAPVLAYGGVSSASSPATGGSGDFCDTHACIENFDNGTGYVVQCADGTYSHSGGIQGACSWHGGLG